MLRQASLQDGEGQTRQVFDTGEPLRLVLELEARPGAPDVTIVIEVRRVAGDAVFLSRTPVATRGGASGRLRFDVPRLGLLGGDYDLAVGDARARGHRPGDRSDAELQRCAHRGRRGHRGPPRQLDLHGRRGRGESVKDPQEALAAARAAAAAAPATGNDETSWNLEDSFVSAKRLAEWAIIEPEQALVYSTRRFGKPITLLKRLLIRLLAST